jgi:hypothetical protein
MAILANQKILTLDYWKRVDKVTNNDYLFTQTGKIVKVKLTQHFLSDNCYRVHFRDYLTIGGDLNLVLPIENQQYRKHVNQYKGHHKFRRPLQYFSIDTLKDLPVYDKRNRLAYSVPTAKPLALPTQGLPIPPFVFGLWIAGRGIKKNIWVAKHRIDAIQEKLKDRGYSMQVKRHLIISSEIIITPSVESQLVPFVPNSIPENYLLASQEQRMELLSGIMHRSARSFKEKINKYLFVVNNKKLFRQVQYLAESLGFKTKSEENHGSYRLEFKSYTALVPEHTNTKPRAQISRRYITRIEKIQPQMCVHIELEDPNETFLVEEGFIACR